MNIKRFLCLFNILLLNSCATLFSQNSKRTSDLNDQRKSNSFLESLFQDESELNASEDTQRDNNRSSLAQGTISNQNKRRNTQIIAPSGTQPLSNIFSLTHIEGNTWRTSAHPAMVFGIMSRIISQSYIISALDRKNFNLQTDWDKFFIDGRLFRNRISVMVFPVSPRQTEVVVKNIVEYYTGGQSTKPEENTAWLPSPDITDEINKLVESTNRQTALVQTQLYSRPH